MDERLVAIEGIRASLYDYDRSQACTWMFLELVDDDSYYSYMQRR